MKNKVRTAACILAAVLLCALPGCQLAQADKGAENCEDRLVGMFVTTEYLDLFDMEGYLNDHIEDTLGGEIVVDGNAREYQGRLYAKLAAEKLTDEQTGETTEGYEYVFEGVEGIPYIAARVPATGEHDSYYTSKADDGISDVHTSINAGDLENSMALEGTLYVSPASGLSTYYLNPVYQSADGRVYAASGSGFSSDAGQSEGAAFSQTMTSSRTLTENGKTVKDSTSVKLSISVMNPPVKITVLQMDGDSLVLSRQEYAPGALPKAIVPQPRAEYVVVETAKAGAEGKTQVARSLYGKDAAFLWTFWRRADGICIKQMTELKWGK